MANTNLHLLTYTPLELTGSICLLIVAHTETTHWILLSLVKLYWKEGQNQNFSSNMFNGGFSLSYLVAMFKDEQSSISE